MKVAEFDNGRIFPAELPNSLYDANTCADGVDRYPTCPECGARVTHISQSQDGKSAHFRHCPTTGCGGSSVAETDTHRALKSVAVETIESVTETISVARSALEECVPAPVSDKENREVDCLVEFEGTDWQLGDGIIIEVQHKNKDKNIQQTTLDYLNLEQDFSVLWLYTPDFYTDSSDVKDWRCLAVQSERDLRDKARSQMWPVKSVCSIWEFPDDVLDDNPAASITSRKASGPTVAERMISSLRSQLSTEPPAAAVRGDAYDEIVCREIKTEYSWSDEVLPDRPTAQDFIKQFRDDCGLPAGEVPVKIPATVAPVLEVSLAIDQGDTPAPPKTPFDDIQCWNCGVYWYAHSLKEKRHYCHQCDAPVSLRWNLDSGRISEIPYWVDNELVGGASSDG